MLSEEQISEGIAKEWATTPCGGCSRENDGQPTLGNFVEQTRFDFEIKEHGIIEGLLRCTKCDGTKNYVVSVDVLLGRDTPA